MDWTRGHWTSDHLKMSVSSFAQPNEPNMDEPTKETSNKHVLLLSGDLEGRKRTLTEKGFEYQFPFKKKS